MIDRKRLAHQLYLHEGRRRYVYDDATGKAIKQGTLVRGAPTIGVGRNLIDRGVRDDEIDLMLENDIDDAIAEAMQFPWFAGLDPVRRAVIVELIFNMGLPRLRGFKNFLRYMSEHRWPHAAEELIDSLWRRQVDPVVGDGKGRADALIHMIKTGEWMT